MSRAPVAVFVYARPDHTSQTLAALASNIQAAESDLYIFSDAAKNETAREQVAKVRAIIGAVQGFSSVTVVEREANMGLARSIVDGVTTLCNRFGRVIVVEDDLVTSPHFLTYMNLSLDRYADQDQVMQVAGYNVCGSTEGAHDAFFLPFSSSWGWATWARAWQHWDAEGRDFDKLVADASLRKRFDLDGSYPYFQMLKDQREGKNNSWAIRWYMTVFVHQGVVLYPRRSMVQNIGFDGSGEHCGVGQEGVSLHAQFQARDLPLDVNVSLPEYQATCLHIRSQQVAPWRLALSSTKRRVLAWLS